MLDIEDIERADDRRERGAWVRNVFRDFPGLALRVRGDGNADHLRLANEITSRATKEEREAKTFAADTQKRLQLEAILVDWNLKTPFSPEAADRLLSRATFREAVEFASLRVAAIGTETLEADAGN